MAKFCINCGKELEEGAKVCSECKQPVEEETVKTEKVVENEPVKQAEKVEIVNNVTTAAPKKGNGMAIAGLVVSLVSCILCCGSLSWLSLIFSIVGIVSAKNVEGKGKGMAIAGLVISIIGMLWLIACFALLPAIGTFVEEAEKSNSYYDSSSYHYGY